MSVIPNDVSLGDINCIYSATDAGLMNDGKDHTGITVSAPSHIHMDVADVHAGGLSRNVKALIRSMPISRKQLGVLISNNRPSAVDGIADNMARAIDPINQRIDEGRMVTPEPSLSGGMTMEDVRRANEDRLPDDANPDFKKDVAGWGRAFRM